MNSFDLNGLPSGGTVMVVLVKIHNINETLSPSMCLKSVLQVAYIGSFALSIHPLPPRRSHLGDWKAVGSLGDRQPDPNVQPGGLDRQQAAQMVRIAYGLFASSFHFYTLKMKLETG